jgi:hypothetical protein
MLKRREARRGMGDYATAMGAMLKKGEIYHFVAQVKPLAHGMKALRGWTGRVF